MDPSTKNLAFYSFTPIADPAALRDLLAARAAEAGLKGTVLIGAEGINAMLAGAPQPADAFVDWLRGEGGFAGLEVKVSWSDEVPFARLKVRVKPEIVTMGVAGVDPARRTAAALPPETLRDWLRGGRDLVLVDTRNDFECELGSFRGALNPRTAAFHEFPDYVRENDAALRAKPVVMFCTGGIRCEKATSWMLEQAGFDEVYQLDGGVLNYFARIPDAERDWEGELFVFDDRVAVDTKLRPTGARLDGEGCPHHPERPMKIELLYIAGCPSHPPTRERLEEVAAELGVAAEIEEVAVADEAQGARLGFLGSPTVLVDGRDLEAKGAGDGEVDTAAAVGLSCRVYRAPDGTRTGVPPRELIARALRQKA